MFTSPEQVNQHPSTAAQLASKDGKRQPVGQSRPGPFVKQRNENLKEPPALGANNKQMQLDLDSTVEVQDKLNTGGNNNIVDHITNSLGSLRSLTNPSIQLGGGAPGDKNYNRSSGPGRILPSEGKYYDGGSDAGEASFQLFTHQKRLKQGQKLVYTYDSIKEAILELYLSVKIRSDDEIDNYNEQQFMNEKAALREVDGYTLIDYIKSSVEVLMDMKMDDDADPNGGDGTHFNSSVRSVALLMSTGN
jgi:hypothetical protein